MVIKRTLVFLILMFSMHTLAFEGTTAADVLRLTKQTVAVSKDHIWPGFDPLAFTRMKENMLQFSPDPNDPKSRILMSLGDDYFSGLTLEKGLEIAVHEAFHGFQRNSQRPGKKWGYGNAMVIFEYKGTSAENNALFAIEARILRDALQTGNNEELRELVRDFLLIRERRQSALDPRFAAFEKGAELNEGLAEYAGTKAVLEAFLGGAAERSGLSFSQASGAAFFTDKYSVLKQINSIGSNVRRRFYYTGSAQAFLLERLMPGKWKTRVQMDGESLQDLLREAAYPLDELLKSRGFDRILELEKAAVRKRDSANRKLLRETLGAKGRLFTVFTGGEQAVSHIIGFDPMNVTMIDRLLRIHTRYVKFGIKGRYTALFNQPVVEDLKKMRFVSVIDGSVKVIADGAEFDPEKNAEILFKKRLRINSSKIEFEADKGRLLIKNGGISVTLPRRN